jgi:formylglycine-generating enzyme required for sulfatase activity
MVVVPSGQFVMGSDSDPTTSPAFEVEIDYVFAISVWEITVSEYRLFCTTSAGGCPDSTRADDEFPVTGVSWNDAHAYVAWLSDQTGFSYRLPTEAEWEYSARAGSVSRYPFGDELLPVDARFAEGKSAEGPLPKGKRSTKRNKFGLRHMVGNVREWVADGWQNNHSGHPADGSAREIMDQWRVVRGGSFRDPAVKLESVAREKADQFARDDRTGIRVLRVIAAE